METLQLTDFFKYRYPSALELSPDGKRLAFAVSTPLSLLYLVAFTLNLQVW